MTKTARARSRPAVCMISAGFFPRIGGVENQLRGLSKHLVDEGLLVTILTRSVEGTPRDDRVDGVPVHRVRCLQRGRTLASLSFLAGGLRWLGRRSFDIFHCHQAYSPLSLAVLAQRRAGDPRIVVKITTSGAFSEVAAVTRELPFRGLRRRLLGRVDAFVAISDEIASELASAGAPPERIVRIPNGVALPDELELGREARSRARNSLGLPFGRLAVFVGRLAAEKGLFVLAEAFKRVLVREPEAGLLLVGEGGPVRSVEPDLRRHVRELGIEASVRFAGRLEDVGPALRAADVFVLPSFTEGMSNALLEAMAFARPVVVSDLPSNRELVTDGENGRLVAAGDSSALAEAIVDVLGSGRRAEVMGRKSRLDVERRFSFEVVAESYAQLYSSLLEGAEPELALDNALQLQR